VFGLFDMIRITAGPDEACGQESHTGHRAWWRSNPRRLGLVTWLGIVYRLITASSAQFHCTWYASAGHSGGETGDGAWQSGRYGRWPVKLIERNGRPAGVTKRNGLHAGDGASHGLPSLLR
jgi:hypothetical protein